MRALRGDRRERLRAMLADLQCPAPWRRWMTSWRRPTAAR